ncbi:hypothetical protein D3C72_617960 [compost metagenome]
MHIDIGTEHGFTDGVEGDVQALFFLEQGFVKFLNLSHVHIDAEQAFDFTLFVKHPIGQRSDMAHAFFDANAELQLKRNAGHQRITDYLFGLFSVFGNDTVVPQLPGRFDVRRDLVHLEHPFVPANDIRL